MLCLMEQRIAALPFHVRNNFVWAACRDNIHSFAQLLVLTGQLQPNAGVRSTAESMLTPHTNAYRRPLDGHPGDAGLNGVNIYFDKQMI